MMNFIQQYHFRCYFISLYDIKSSFHVLTLIVAAFLDIRAAILKIDQFGLANELNPITHTNEHSTKFHACIWMYMIIVTSRSTNRKTI